MEYNDIFNDIPQSYFDYILREKRGKMNLEHFVNSGYNEWMSVLDLTSIKLTEDEVIKFGYIYRSKFFPKKSQKGEIVTMTFDLSLANEGDPIGVNPSMFSSLMCNGNDLLDSVKSFEVINTKNNAQNSINYITEEIGSLTVKVSRPLTENSYYALVINFPEQNGVYISYVRCTEENMPYDFVKIDDTTYDCTFTSYLNEAIEYGGQISIIFFDTINGLPEDFLDYDEFNDFELFNSNINNIINTTLECQTQIFFPSSEGIYVVEGELKEGVTSIGNYAFNSCSSLTNITFVDDSQLTSIGEGAFQECNNLTSIEIPKGVTSIGEGAFNGCVSLTNITFVDDSQLTSIGHGAFQTCQNLTSIEIPSGVTSIGDSTFNTCSNLTSITFGDDSQLTSIGEWTFVYCDNLTSIEIPSSVTSIGERAFAYCYNLTSIKIPSSVTSIGKEAFQSCQNLTSIEIPSGVTSIGEWTFNGCVSLTSIIFANDSQLTSIGDNAFSDCDNLTSIEIPSSVTSIGVSAFARCYNLTSIKIPSSVTSIGVSVFSQCQNLTSITFGDDSQLTSIGGSAFIYCQNLTSIEIPSGVTSIGQKAFYYCQNLTSIEIPSGVTSIGVSTFEDCASLTSITCHAITAPSVQSNTFKRIASNGTLYYPKGSDYSSWLGYLGGGWQGIEI